MPTILNFRYCCPNKLSQYMQAGLPVMAGNTAYVSQILAESGAGLCYDPADPESIVATVRRLVQDEDLRRRCRQNAARFVRETFHWQARSKPLYEAYRRLAGLREVQKTTWRMTRPGTRQRIAIPRCRVPAGKWLKATRNSDMCGIAGVFDISGCPVDRLEARLRRMNAVQRHRGPDGEGVWTSPSGCAGLGHVRLSVVDPEGGAQPMVDEEAGLTIVFNGEIYNFRELRIAACQRAMPSRPVPTPRSSSTPTASGAAACVEHLRGMFSFAIWDERKRALLLARDRFGIKPLYTAWVGERFYFASEVKALLPFLPDVRIDYRGLRDYLTFQFYLQGKTLFRDVREVPPATSCLVDAQGERATTYWQVQYRARFGP